jgi:mono/diheme cytochrome c family protein
MRRTTLIILLAMICAACGPAASPNRTPDATPDVPSGDAAAGDTLFHQKIGGLPECSTCHSLDGTRGTGPTLQGYGEIAGSRRGGEDAVTYTMNSIVNPGQYVVPGFSNLMPAAYGQLLSRDQLADLIAYVLDQ